MQLVAVTLYTPLCLPLCLLPSLPPFLPALPHSAGGGIEEHAHRCQGTRFPSTYSHEALASLVSSTVGREHTGNELRLTTYGVDAPSLCSTGRATRLWVVFTKTLFGNCYAYHFQKKKVWYKSAVAIFIYLLVSSPPLNMSHTTWLCWVVKIFHADFDSDFTFLNTDKPKLWNGKQ